MIHYRINRKQRLLTLRFEGEVTVGQLKRVLVRAIAECPEAIGFDTLSDGRTPHSLLKFGEVVRLARINHGLGMHDRPRRAVGLVGSKAHFGISRMFELFTEDDSKVARFTTDSIQAAADWLCRPVALIRAELDAVGRQDSPEV